MVDFLLNEPGGSLIGDVLWQSGLFLVVGLAASVALHRRPARAHGALFVAILAALVTPLCSQLARRHGWGLWASRSIDRPRIQVALALATSSPQAVHSGATGELPPRASSHRPIPAGMSATTEEPDPGARPLLERPAGLSDRSSNGVVIPRSPRAILIAAWCMFSGLCLVRLVASVVLGYGVVCRARCIPGGALTQAAEAAATRLGLRARPDLRMSANLACPAIWCWRHRPVILLPETATAALPVDWAGVFCHELAHWVRRDHWSNLLAEVLTCLLPWQPLAWWAKHRLGQLSELACDDWVLSTGLPPTDYAESLLELIPQRAGALALAAVSSRRGLIGRVGHILEAEGSTVEPRAGRRWSRVVALAAIGLVGIIALARVREGRAGSRETQETRDHGPTAPPASPRDQVTHRVVRGAVRDGSGKPVAGASIFAVAELEYTQSKDGWNFTHHGQPSRILAQVASDREGRFVLDLAIDPAVIDVVVIARSAGMGLTGRNFSARPDERGRMFFQPLGERPVELTLRLNIPIEGRLLSETSTPVPGVPVALAVLELEETPSRDEFFLTAPEDGEGRPVRRPYWPEPIVTDAQGRFRLDGSSEKAVARVAVTHDAYIHEQLIISTESELTGYRKAWRIKPILPRFTHVLEPARPIEGIVTDQDTGQPLADVHVEIGATGSDLLSPLPATTDTQGRYRITGIAWDNPQGLFAQVIPNAASGYLPDQHQRDGWPVGARELRWNLTLKKGRLLQGRVIDAGTKRPISGAAVTGELQSHTVFTDNEGHFSLSVDPGHRSLFVEGPTPDYQRVTVPRGEVESTYGTYHPHGYARISVTAEGSIARLEVALKKGATIAAQAVDREGHPLRDVWVSGESLFVGLNHSGVGSGHCSLGSFRSASFEPGRIYRLFFIQNERHLAGFADLTARSEPTEPIAVMLRETARVRGKLLRADGLPDRRKGVLAYLLLTRDEIKLDPMDFLTDDRVLSYGQAARLEGGLWQTKTDDQGAFEVDHLVAGVRNYLTFALSSKVVEYISLEPLRPGEFRDLGTIKPIVLTNRQP
jgi:hypothetical protein